MNKDMSKHQSYYMVIPSEIWDAKITARAMILYGHITVLSNKKKYCYANNSYFEKIMKSSNSSIARAMKELEDNKFIRREIIYREGSKEIEERKIFLTTGIVTDDNRPVVTDDNRPVVTDDPDNITRSNNTRSNNKLDETSASTDIKDFYGKLFFRIVEAYPKNRIGNRQHGLKKFNTLSIEEAKLAALNLKRYLAVTGSFVKSLQNYIVEKCFTEEWLSAEELNQNSKLSKDNKSIGVKTFNTNYENF
jgi:hypothetical protein